eukprot:SAG22_NODE_15644_length_344_cov_0.836735_1_plen_94_part_01
MDESPPPPPPRGSGHTRQRSGSGPPLTLLSEIAAEQRTSQDFTQQTKRLEQSYWASQSELSSVNTAIQAEIAGLSGLNLDDLDATQQCREPSPE